jgi:hypothetical protein
MSAGCSKAAGGVTSNEKQLAANRGNAKKSTGPKTRAGKAMVALNSVAHGIYCVSPVIEGSESKRAWTAYRFAMLDNLAPIGMLELTLAERIILTAWRLRRITHFETAQIRIAQESAFEDVGRTLKFKLDRHQRGADEVDVQKILDEPSWREWRWRSVSALATASDTTVLAAEEAEDLLWYVHEQLGQTADFDRYCSQLTAPNAWQMGWIRQLIRGLCEKHRKPFEELLRTLSTRAAEEHAKSLDTATVAHASLEKYRREHLLPDTEDLEKIQRYEAHLSRQFHRDLHELQRLQAARLGHPVAAPIAIDVDVSTESKPATETAV